MIIISYYPLLTRLHIITYHMFDLILICCPIREPKTSDKELSKEDRVGQSWANSIFGSSYLENQPTDFHHIWVY